MLVVVVVEIKTTDCSNDVFFYCSHKHTHTHMRHADYNDVFYLFTQNTNTYETCRLQLLNVKATRKLQATTIHDRLRHANA